MVGHGVESGGAAGAGPRDAAGKRGDGVVPRVGRWLGGRKLLAVWGAVVIAAAGDGGPARPDEPAPAGAVVRWDAQVAAASAAGAPPEQALEVFAAVFGPLPGAPPASSTMPPTVGSGTAAVRLLLRHWQALSVEQQRAASARLLPTPGGSAAFDGLTADPELTERARTIAEQMAARMGVVFARPVDVSTGRLDHAHGRGSRTVAWALPVHADADGRYRIQVGEVLDRCLVAIDPDAVGADERVLESTLAHEVMHCLQYDIMGLNSMFSAPSWLIEGSAEWAGERHVGGTPDGEFHWADYLQEPRPLFGRSYSAIGFWGQLNGAAAGDLWSSLAGILRAYEPGTSPGDDFATAVGIADERFLDHWAAGLVRRPDLGDAWQLVTGIDVPRELAHEPEQWLVGEVPFEGLLLPGMQRAWQLQVAETDTDRAATALSLEVQGHGRLAWLSGGGPDAAPVQDRRTFGSYHEVLCLDGACDCPGQPGQPGQSAPALPPAPSRTVLVAATGTTTSATVRARLLDACDGYEVPEEAIGVALARQGIDFTWPCPGPDDPGYRDPDLHCMSSGIHLPRRTMAGHVAFIRSVTQFHDSSYVVLMSGPEELRSPIPVTPTGMPGQWRVRNIAELEAAPESWLADGRPSFIPAERVCVDHDPDVPGCAGYAVVREP